MSGLCVVMWVVVGGGFIVVCRCGSVCNQIKDGHMVARNMLSNL